MTLNAALERYWQERGQFCGSAMSAVDLHSRHLVGYFGPDRFLDEIGDAEISEYRLDQIGKLSARKRPISNSTINRRMEFLRTIIRRARMWGKEVQDINLKELRLDEPEARTRWLTPEESARLIECAATHLKAPIEFALYTGARLSNVVGLRWEDVNLMARKITLRGVKSTKPGGKTLEIPMSLPCKELLLAQKPKKAGYVFLRHFKPNRKTGLQRKPEPITKFRRSFATACKEAGITNFRFHDLRHTAASYMIQNGVPLELVKDILGHSDISMTMKYAHHSDKEKVDAMEILGNAAQIRHNGLKENVA